MAGQRAEAHEGGADRAILEHDAKVDVSRRDFTHARQDDEGELEATRAAAAATVAAAADAAAEKQSIGQDVCGTGADLGIRDRVGEVRDAGAIPDHGLGVKANARYANEGRRRVRETNREIGRFVAVQGRAVLGRSHRRGKVGEGRNTWKRGRGRCRRGAGSVARCQGNTAPHQGSASQDDQGRVGATLLFGRWCRLRGTGRGSDRAGDRALGGVGQRLGVLDRLGGGHGSKAYENRHRLRRGFDGDHFRHGLEARLRDRERGHAGLDANDSQALLGGYPQLHRVLRHLRSLRIGHDPDIASEGGDRSAERNSQGSAKASHGPPLASEENYPRFVLFADGAVKGSVVPEVGIEPTRAWKPSGF